MNAIILKAYFGVKNFFSNEVRRIKEDESGMELIQVILIILMVVVIAAVLWTFLSGYISDLLSQIFDAPEPTTDDIVSPY